MRDEADSEPVESRSRGLEPVTQVAEMVSDEGSEDVKIVANDIAKRAKRYGGYSRKYLGRYLGV